MGGEYRDDIVIVASKLNVDSVASVKNEWWFIFTI
jgi:hypothetical protein